MKLLTPQNSHDETPDLFLAGNIAGAPDWQSDAAAYFGGTPLAIANPRRSDHIANEGPAARAQIAWEQAMLSRSGIVLFWLSKGGLGPITLFELGQELGRVRAPIFVGCEEGFHRHFDVKVQVELAQERQPGEAIFGVFTELPELLTAVKNFI